MSAVTVTLDGAVIVAVGALRGAKYPAKNEKTTVIALAISGGISSLANCRNAQIRMTVIAPDTPEAVILAVGAFPFNCQSLNHIG